MPKRVLIFLAAISLGLAVPACHNNSGSTVTPTPAPSITPNPSITAATVDVTILGSPAANIPVQESTPKSSSSPRPGTPFVTKRTHKDGTVKFKDLKPSQTYCWVAILGPKQTSSTCAGWETWQFQPIQLGSP
jgi:hypothetical protein